MTKRDFHEVPKYLVNHDLVGLEYAAKIVVSKLEGKSDATPGEKALLKLCRGILGWIVEEK